MKHCFKKCREFDVHKNISWIGLVSILIYVITQSLETFGFVHVCVFCQTIRVCIGLIGLIMILPICPIFSRLFTFVIAYMGAHVAADGIFINIERATYFTSFTVLAVGALIILAAQVMMMVSYCSGKK